METRRLILRFLALGTLFLILSGVFWQWWKLYEPLLVLSAISFTVAAFLRIQLYKRVRDRYDLNALNDIIREGTYDESDIPEADHEGDKYCLCCHTSYGSQFGVCPNCAKK